MRSLNGLRPGALAAQRAMVPDDRGLADSFGLPRAEGALVSAAEKGSPAERAGLEVGDARRR